MSVTPHHKVPHIFYFCHTWVLKPTADALDGISRIISTPLLW
jgi:hypothetical protein